MDQSRQTELKHRVEARRRELQARMHQLAADTSAASRKQSERLAGQLQELKHEMAEQWTHLSDAAADRLLDWLKRTDEESADSSSTRRSGADR